MEYHHSFMFVNIPNKMLGLYLSWESFSVMHDSYSHIISARPAILCFFDIHYSYYTKANLFDWYKNPALFTYPDTGVLHL